MLKFAQSISYVWNIQLNVIEKAVFNSIICNKIYYLEVANSLNESFPTLIQYKQTLWYYPSFKAKEDVLSTIFFSLFHL